MKVPPFIATRLEGVEGVWRLPGHAPDAAQNQEPARTLANLLTEGALEVPGLLELATHLARTLSAMHMRGVLHLNINPTHVLLHGARRLPLLIGFEGATTFAQQRPGFTHHREIRGNLIYLAPEQTGRTGRSVDLRADLYALGVTLFEAATGRPPFVAQDPIQLLHEHLVKAPPSPARLRAELPASLERIILRLLEKEPERRYQSAEGLAHDLEQVQSGAPAALNLGERDFPMQLSAPSRLVGRDSEIAQLQTALEDAVDGRGRVVMVAGAPGVGKTTLINELRPMVTGRRGWFVSGKFDQYRHDAPTATVQALRALGRLLLAEPEADLARHRERILRALGANAALVCGMAEYATLLGPQAPVPAAEPAQAEARLLSAVVELLRAIVSPERPVVMVLDDLQWGAGVSVRFVDALLYADPVPGLLLVGSYRDSEVDASHSLGAALARWRGLVAAPLELQLQDLPPRDLQMMLQQMMRLAPAQAAALAHAVGDHTGGNPYDTVELLNALRRDGVLRTGSAGWEWDAGNLRRYVGQSGVLDLLAARIARLPATGQALLEVMACLGGPVRHSLLCAAAGLAPRELDAQLVAPLEDGLLVIEPGHDSALRMRHDRVQQAVYGTLLPGQRRAIHLALARRLVGMAQFQVVALEQYLPAHPNIDNAAECRSVAALFHGQAARARSSANFAVAQNLLAAALALLSRVPAPETGDNLLRESVEVELHVILCTLARFEEADVLYASIERRTAPPEDWIEAACAQVDSLHSRSRPREAVTLGLELMRRLGLDPPQDFASSPIEQRLAQLGQWVDGLDVGRDLRPYTGDRRTTGLVDLIIRLTYPAHHVDVRIMGWLILEAQVIWERCGPSPALVHALASLGGVAIGINQDYRTGYHGSRHAMRISEARGWEPSTSEARFVLAAHATHWFEPLQHELHELRVGREGLLRHGELQMASLTYRPSTTALLDCCRTLDGLSEEVESGMALARRMRSEYAIATMVIERDLLRALRGERDPIDGEDRNDALQVLQRQSSIAAVALSVHCTKALRAALFDDLPALSRHAAAAMPHVQHIANYRGAQARVLQAFALVRAASTSSDVHRQHLLGQFDQLHDWLARRAEDAPQNFAHLWMWLSAERASVAQDFRAAAAAFDAALAMVEMLVRPWHHALIAERTGLFHLAHGMTRTGRRSIREALDLYRAWGAELKARQLEATHDFLKPAPALIAVPRARPRKAGPVDPLDTLAILRASHAISSETSLPNLQARVIELMGALTGATTVRFALWDEDFKNWFLSAGEAGHDTGQSPPIPLLDAAARGQLSLSAFRYAERTQEALLVDDASRDDRFARDPYFASARPCSLLFVPILSKGSMRAMLLLENRRSRGAFTTGRLDAILLIAGQLAVSLENALVHDRLEQRVRDQTRELVATARRAGMAQIATNVLHNVGNVLNSVNVSAKVLDAHLRQSRAARLRDLAQLLQSNEHDLAGFIAEGGKGRLMSGYLRDLANALEAERDDMLSELDRMGSSVDHIKNVVAMQLSYAGAGAGGSALELCSITEVVEDALHVQEASLLSLRIVVERDYAPFAAAPVDKTRLIQIVLNLVENAYQGLETVQGERKLRIAVRQEGAWIAVTVADNGCGIPAENLDKIFAHGFTTRLTGHGFGLHSCAMAAREMGGTLEVQSAGAGQGATFILHLPAHAAGQPASAST